MYVTFKNESGSSKAVITVDNQRYILNQISSVDVFCLNSDFEFYAESSALRELAEAVEDIDDKDKKSKLKDRILTKLAKKAAEKLPDTVLNTVVRYKASLKTGENLTVNLSDGAYAMFSGRFSEFLDFLPIAYVFLRAESANAVLSVVDVKLVNRKKYLKLVRSVLLFMHAGLTSLNLLFFLPEYIIIKLFSSEFYVKRVMSRLYKHSQADRESILQKRAERQESERKKLGCFPKLLIFFVGVIVLLGTCVYFMISDPDVVISEDMSSVEYFEEIFVKYDGELPSDVKKAVFEESIAFYPLADGGYDMENYFCTIYESSDGIRYMWLQDDYSDPENADKEYEDYENPLVYISTGKIE